MATLAAMSTVFAACFAGLQAVASIVTAYQQYRTNHPRKSITGARNDYVTLHKGFNLCHELFLDQKPFYLSYTERLLPPLSQGQPVKRYSLTRFKRSISKRLGSTLMNSRQQQKLGGDITVSQIQKVQDTYRDSYVGLNTGKQPMYDINKAEDHWMTVEDGRACTSTSAPTIAVVNWTTQIVTMFVKEKDWETERGTNGMFFRNYQVQNANLLRFAKEYMQQLVFTGILDEEKLQGSKSPIVIVEDDRTCTLKSTNCWTLLGLPGATELPREEFMFLEMQRAALFGLVECRFQDPTLLNVDMRDGGDGSSNGSGMEIVHVDTPDLIKLSYAPSCIFSVFAFNAEVYAKDRVLIG